MPQPAPDEVARALIEQLRTELVDDRALWQLAAIALCGFLAWLLTWHFAHWQERRLHRRADRHISQPADEASAPVEETTVLDGDPADIGQLTAAAIAQREAAAELAAREEHAGARRPAPAGVFFPAVLYLLLVLATGILEHYQPVALLHLALVLAGAVAAIRLMNFFLARLPDSATLAAVRHSIVAAIGLGVILHVLGQLDPVTEALSTMQLSLAGGQWSVLELLRSIFWLAIILLFAYWLGSLLEARLLRTTGIDISLRIALARVLRAVLLLIAVMVGLSALGIDVTALSVFSGALGVGIGLGLQRIASNYLSGLIILLERSIRPGDAIRIGSLEGVVTAVRTRYSVLEVSEGGEIIVPNETLTGQMVHNVTTGGRLLRTIQLQIAYGCDVDEVSALLLAAARSCPQVLHKPEPSARVLGFRASGLLFELAFYVPDRDTSNETGAAVNRAVYIALRRADLQIVGA